MGQINHNKEAEINQNKYSYVIVFIILTYCFITKLTAIAMHGNKIPYDVASCDVAIKQFNQSMLPMNGQIRIQVISVYMYSSQSTLYNASDI